MKKDKGVGIQVESMCLVFMYLELWKMRLEQLVGVRVKKDMSDERLWTLNSGKNDT